MEVDIDIGTNENGDKFILGSQLHNYLGVGTVFTKWIQREIDKYGFEAGVDYDLMFNIPENIAMSKMESLNLEENVKKMTPQQRSAFGVSTEYVLTMDVAKMLAMVSKTDAGMTIRKYFIKCEELAHNPTPALSKKDELILVILNT